MAHHQPYSNLEVAQEHEYSQKEVVQYPDHSIPQALPAEEQGANSPEAVGYAQEAHIKYPPGHFPGAPVYSNGLNQQHPYTVLPGSYKDPNGGYGDGGGVPAAGVAAAAIGAHSPMATSTAPYSGSPWSGATANSDPSYQQHQQDGGAEKSAAPATICGLKRRTFFIALAVGIVVIIAAIVGGVVGGVVGSRSGDDSSSASADQAGSSSGGSGSGSNGNSTGTGNDDSVQQILTESKLAAANFTDADGVVHRSLFFQDAYNALISMRWDSGGKTWAKDNLTAMMAATTRPLNPQAGTPLACASMERDPKFETHLWFVDPQWMIRSLAAADPVGSPSSWENDTLDEAQLQTWPGGQLAATWQRCWNAEDCDGWWIVAYQRPEGAIKTANSSIWGTATVAVESADVSANSSLTLTPMLRGAYLDRFELGWEAPGNDVGTLQMTYYNETWTNSGNRDTQLIADVPAQATDQQFAATKLGNWRQSLYVALLGDGTVKGNYYDGRKYNVLSSISFADGPVDDPKFSAIAMTDDAMFYGIVDDQILEYQVDAADPSQLKFVGVVFK
ncbi:hypothetical protein F4778DRAFT_445010 [Xylariomycetidae sp. FL2044]|nr:hypothetical protein F4778DRAFT_445010 [Xylariomycetidae sp. FL2044]